MTLLRTLLTTVQVSGLQFSEQKSNFAYQDLTLLGLGISRYRMSTLIDRTRSVLNLKEPQPIRELHLLVSMFGYY